MHTKLALSVLAIIIVAGQSSAHHLSALNLEGRYASAIQNEHQRWLDGQFPDNDKPFVAPLHNYEDFLSFLITFNNCDATKQSLDQCYENTENLLSACADQKRSTLGYTYGYSSCTNDLSMAYTLMVEFEIQNIVDRYGSSYQFPISDLRDSQTAWETYSRNSCAVFSYFDESANKAPTMMCSNEFAKERVRELRGFQSTSGQD